MTLSKASQTFLDNLRVYLFASNKKEEEVKDLLEELEDHLYEAEQNGKSIEHIIGNSPKAYMKEVEAEVDKDGRFWILYMPMIILGAFAYLVMDKVLDNDRSYSMLSLIGNPVVFIVSILGLFGLYRYNAANHVSKKIEMIGYILFSIIQFSLFIGLLFADNYIESPIFTITPAANTAFISISFLVFVGLAIFSKTWFVVVMPILFFIPQLISRYIQISENTELVFLFCILLGLAAYMFWEAKRMN
ncbi:Uncharacterized membrane-anchored protein [Terribacillus aidingensis]|uniref:Uncharacterized membrane-anchored protein n=1 Tax=Terribacillus aidingensis TaxID=586416 RepID=A0A285MZ51_9BACI|nr:hypothetical protein [Terribacillus aidingensis]SNZ02490.1 Uncharacterized membrane-anchored protein [Terribacillus aidingensis]